MQLDLWFSVSHKNTSYFMESIVFASFYLDYHKKPLKINLLHISNSLEKKAYKANKDLPPEVNVLKWPNLGLSRSIIGHDLKSNT